MIVESLSIIVFALFLDFIFGDPKNKYHPTAWIGSLIAKLTPTCKNSTETLERLGGIFLIVISCTFVSFLVIIADLAINLISVDYVSLIISIVVGGILLKTTIAIRGMEKHSMDVVNSIEANDLSSARNNLSMIVKRNTKDLDQNHVFSGVVESISENTVDGITAPLFYFGFFGLPGAFVYRVINTADSMIGYKSSIFKNIGWFAANCDNVLNFVPARLTGLTMVLSAMILGCDWKRSYKIMIRDGKKTTSPNAGYPMAAIAGALGTRFEKINHYSLGEGDVEFSKEHVKSAISLMKLTSIVFCGLVICPIVVVLSLVGWWIHA